MTKDEIREKIADLIEDILDFLDWDNAYDVADHLLANGVTFADESKWIPVSEQKPEENKEVQLYTDGHLVFTTVLVYSKQRGVRLANRLKVDPVGIPYLDEHATNGWEWSRGNEDATHWMPLPEPPKEDGNA